MEAHLISSSSDSQSSMSLNKKPVQESPTCYFDPSTCQRQNFSIPEKIVFYMAKNVTNAKTFQKLIETCKYFFKVNPVIVVHQVRCVKDKWCACYDMKYRVGFKYDQPLKFKIWVTHEFDCFPGPTSKVISSIYKNDATDVILRSERLKFDDFLFIVGNVEKLSMLDQLVIYENGESVQLEDIVKNLPKLKSLNFSECFDGSDVNCNTVRKLLEIEHFKNISQLSLYNVCEVLDVKEMFKYICENKHTVVDICYRSDISDACKELIQEYSKLLEKENRWSIVIHFIGTDLDELQAPPFEDESFDDVFFDVDENEDLMFPWKNEDEEEWELPWDKTE